MLVPSDTVRYTGSSGRYGDVEVTHIKSPIIERRRIDVTHPTTDQPQMDGIIAAVTPSTTGNGRTINNGGSSKEVVCSLNDPSSLSFIISVL